MLRIMAQLAMKAGLANREADRASGDDEASIHTAVSTVYFTLAQPDVLATFFGNGLDEEDFDAIPFGSGIVLARAGKISWDRLNKDIDNGKLGPVISEVVFESITSLAYFFKNEGYAREVLSGEDYGYYHSAPIGDVLSFLDLNEKNAKALARMLVDEGAVDDEGQELTPEWVEWADSGDVEEALKENSHTDAASLVVRAHADVDEQSMRDQVFKIHIDAFKNLIDASDMRFDGADEVTFTVPTSTVEEWAKSYYFANYEPASNDIRDLCTGYLSEEDVKADPSLDHVYGVVTDTEFNDRIAEEL